MSIWGRKETPTFPGEYRRPLSEEGGKAVLAKPQRLHACSPCRCDLTLAVGFLCTPFGHRFGYPCLLCGYKTPHPEGHGYEGKHDDAAGNGPPHVPPPSLFG